MGEMYAVLLGFMFILSVVWILLPFAIFGTKPKLDALIEQSKATNAHLSALVALLRASGATPQTDTQAPSEPPAPYNPSPAAYGAGKAIGGMFRRDR